MTPSKVECPWRRKKGEKLNNQILTNRQMVEQLKAKGALKTLAIIDAFTAIDRADFITSKEKTLVYQDHPLPLGLGQTISQPSTVAFMLEQLQLQRGDKVLDVGAGSGWTTALLGKLVGKDGRVIGLEILPELAERAQANLAQYSLLQVEVRAISGYEGLASEAPFNKILASAAANELPEALPAQLAPGGRLILPVKNSLVLVERSTKNKFSHREFPGFAFVPLLGGGGDGYGAGTY